MMSARIESSVGQFVARRVGQVYAYVPFRETLVKIRELNVDDAVEMLAFELMEDRDVVDAIQELGLDD